MDQTNNRELEIDLGKIFYKMRNKFIFIFLITILAGIITGIYTQFAIKPTYSATVKMFVYSNTDRIASDSTITAGELTASQDLVNTYIYILESDTVLDAVIDDLDLNISAGALRGAITASKAKDTMAFEVSVKAKNPKTAAKIANSIAKIAPSEIIRVVKAGGVEIIDYAKIPTRPSSPNLKKNIAIAVILGLVGSFALFFIYELFDTTVTSARDIENEFDIPILGTVPNLEPVSSSSKEVKYNSPVSGETDEKPKFSIEDSFGLKPSDSILENLQSMKEESKND